MNKKKRGGKTEVWVRYYRMSDEEIEKLQNRLSAHDGIENVEQSNVRYFSTVEMGTLLTCVVVPFLARYAGNKVLDFVYDEVREWWKYRKKDSGFIVLGLNKQKRQVGRGRPKKYRDD
jgi:hypothetical protein